MAPCVSLYAILGLLCATYAAAETVVFQECPAPEEGPGPRNCQVHEVRVNPCPDAAESKPCKVKRGHDAAIAFDFTPANEIKEAETRAFWAHSMGDLPFVGMNTVACSGTTCPLAANVRASYHYDLQISKKFPVRAYDVKWRLWNDTADVECCFIIKIKLTK